MKGIMRIQASSRERAKQPNTSPLISVIVPVYNVENYIRKCIQTLQNQTYRNLEILLIDDGTPDGSGEICEDYARSDSRIRVFHKANGGLSDARNYGIERATGEYVVCVDSDDYVDADYVEYLWGMIEKTGCTMSICQHRTFYENGSVKDNGAVGEAVISQQECIERMLYHDVIDTSAWAKLYKKSLFDCVKYPKGKLFEDIGTTYALMLQCETIAVGYESKYNYVFHNNSIVNGSFSPKKLDMVEMTDRMAADVIKKYPDLSEAITRRRVYARFSTLNQMLMITDSSYIEQRRELIRFIKAHSRDVLFDPRAPKRDKAAIVLLLFNYRLYRRCWLYYTRKIMAGQ